MPPSMIYATARLGWKSAAPRRSTSSPVRWTDTIRNMIADGVDTFIEFGPGNTLTGLVRRIAPEATALNVEAPEGLKKCLEALSAKEAANA